MKRRPGNSLSRASKRSPIAALALTAMALTILTAGCVKDHDPRNDSSGIDTQPRDVSAISIDHVRA